MKEKTVEPIKKLEFTKLKDITPNMSEIGGIIPVSARKAKEG